MALDRDGLAGQLDHGGLVGATQMAEHGLDRGGPPLVRCRPMRVDDGRRAQRGAGLQVVMAVAEAVLVRRSHRSRSPTCSG